MNGGWFGDGGTAVGLGEKARIDVAYENSPLLKEIVGRGDAAVMETGGDRGLLRVTGTHRAANAAGAERFGYEALLALGGTGPGALVVNGQQYPGCFFVRGSARTLARCEARLELEFVESARTRPVTLGAGSGDGGAEAAPGAPSPGLWTFGGTALGDCAAAEFSTRRPVVAKRIPRCYGVRLRDMRFGRVMEAVVTAWLVKASRAELEKYVYELAENFGCAARALVGNGYAYGEWCLIGAEVGEGGWREGEMRLRVRRQ